MTDILTAQEVASRLKLPGRTVAAMFGAREIPGFQLRGQWRVLARDFERWLAGVAAGSAADEAGVGPNAAGRGDDPPAAATVEGEAFEPRGVQHPAERVAQAAMHRRFLDALSPGVRHHTPTERKPLELDLDGPAAGRLRVYLYNVTRPPGGRPSGEHKIQLIVPGQRRGERGDFDDGDGRTVVLAGYSAEEDAFVLWDAGLYAGFAWSRNVQVKARTLAEAAAGTVASQERHLRPADGRAVTEILVACPTGKLREGLARRLALTRARSAGDAA